MDSGVLASLIAVGAAGIGGVVQWWRGSRLEKRKAARALLSSAESREDKRYDQLQEDLHEERLRVAERDATIALMVVADRVKDDYIFRLRQQIDDRRGPPPEPWPVSLTKEGR